jgi:hypothetical protein
MNYKYGKFYEDKVDKGRKLRISLWKVKSVILTT